MNAQHGTVYPAGRNNQMLAKFQYYHHWMNIVLRHHPSFHETFSQDVTVIKPLKIVTLLKVARGEKTLIFQSTLQILGKYFQLNSPRVSPIRGSDLSSCFVLNMED